MYKYCKKLNNLIFIILPIIAGMYLLFLGIERTAFPIDEAYQSLSAKNYKDAPLAMLIFYVGNIWITYYGDSFFSLRCLSRICYIISISIGCLFLYKKSRKLYLTSFIFLLCCLLATIGEFDIYNWDTGNYPICALGLFLMLIFIEFPSLFHLIICSVIIGIMCAARITNIIVWVIWIYILIINKSSNFKSSTIFINLLLSISICLLSWGIIVFMMTGTISNYIHSFNSENIITGHNVSALNRYVWNAINIFPIQLVNWIPSIFSLIITLLLYRINRYKSLFRGIGIFLCMVTSIMALKLSQSLTTYQNPMFTIGLPAFLIICLFLPYQDICNRNKNEYPYGKKNKIIYHEILVTIFFVFLLGIGSDNMFQRWNVSFALPIAIGLIWNTLNKTQKKISSIWFALFFISLITIFPIKNIYAQKSFPEVTTSIPKLAHIQLHEDYAYHVNSIDSAVNLIDSHERIAFFGRDALLMTDIFEHKPLFPIQNFHVQERDTILLKERGNQADWIILINETQDGKITLKKEQQVFFNYLTSSDQFKLYKKNKYYNLYKVIKQENKDAHHLSPASK